MIVELKYPCTTDLNHFPSSATDRCLRLRSSSFSALNLAESRWRMVLRRTRNVPDFHVCPQMWVKPRKLNVSGFPAPRSFGLRLRSARTRSTASCPGAALVRTGSGVPSSLGGTALRRRGAEIPTQHRRRIGPRLLHLSPDVVANAGPRDQRHNVGKRSQATVIARRLHKR